MPSQCKWSKLLDALQSTTQRVFKFSRGMSELAILSSTIPELGRARVMTRSMTPPPATEIPDHAPPSFPNSPLAKRSKTAATTMAPSATESESNAPALPKFIFASQSPLLIKKLSAKATTPTRGSALAAGYDLYSAHETVVPARGKTLVDTDLAIAVPEGTCMQGQVFSSSCGR